MVRPPVIRLLDLGLSDDFLKSMTFAQSLLSSLTVGSAPEDVEYMHVRNLFLAARAMTLPARLIHVMAHGTTSKSGQAGFESDDHHYFFGLEDLATYLREQGEGIEADGIFADACGTADEAFIEGIRDALEGECTYIGATRTIDWRESTTFASILYGSLLSWTGPGTSGPDWVETCAGRAIRAYAEAVGGPCPFTTTVLRPSHQASGAFRKSTRGAGLG
ncbi:MAG TPA: hypothetical protein VHD81_04885 [Mycobacteriales bacterium]|nr:hypothetical protein [Mycobacteriales bacterium]